jgi:Putative transmembrane protein (PGPGW)
VPGQVRLLGRGVRLGRRILLTVLGVAVLGVGVVLLAAPGPGFLVIALGFFILSIEYDWARRRFEYARKKAADLADQAAASVLSTTFTIIFALGTIAAGIVWIIVTDLPASGPWAGGSLIFSGLVILSTILVSLRQAARARAAGEPTPADLLERPESRTGLSPPGGRDSAPSRRAGC